MANDKKKKKRDSQIWLVILFSEAPRSSGPGFLLILDPPAELISAFELSFWEFFFSFSFFAEAG
jgi:hypothetical protein